MMRAIVLIVGLAALGASTPQAAEAQQATPDAALVARGAQIYGTNCARCHNLRSPTEYNDLNWRTIMAQMRARANLTRDQARAVLAFVQMTNGVPSASATSDMGDAAPSAPAVEPAPAGKSLTPAQKQQLRAYLARLASRTR